MPMGYIAVGQQENSMKISNGTDSRPGVVVMADRVRLDSGVEIPTQTAAGYATVSIPDGGTVVAVRIRHAYCPAKPPAFRGGPNRRYATTDHLGQWVPAEVRRDWNGTASVHWGPG